MVMADLETTPTLEDRITGVAEPAVLDYFISLNAGNYHATAALFSPDGVLNPPFEEPVVGREAIAAYLQAEAAGMQLHPHQGSVVFLEANGVAVQVKGKVQTSLFTVNVGWQFILNAQGKINSATINLLASLEELLPLRR